jgi:hypothetical protein
MPVNIASESRVFHILRASNTVAPLRATRSIDIRTFSGLIDRCARILLTGKMAETFRAFSGTR